MDPHLVDVVVIRSNTTINSDPRTPNIYRSLSKKYSTLVLGWDRQGISREEVSKVINRPHLDLKLFNIRAPSSGTPYLIVYFPLFWAWILVQLFIHKPKVVHACDLDTIVPGYIYKLLRGKKLIFDVSDRYAMAYIPPKFKRLYSVVNSLEDFFAYRADVLLNVSDDLERTFPRKPESCATIMNCSEDLDVSNNKSENNVLTIAFTGHVRRGRGLEQMVAAIRDLNDVELVVAGQVWDKSLLNEILKTPNVKYRGFLSSREALILSANSDVMVALYDPNHYAINKFAMGVKIFEAMMCGVPLVTNVAQDLISKEGCGILVEYNSVDQVKATIIRLRDSTELRRTLGINGRKAFLERYNWNAMEQRLYEIYDKLLQK
jgi:glycosyltransferase involved in cell wall biosynthesis